MELTREQVAQGLCSATGGWSITACRWEALDKNQREFYFAMADYVQAQLKQQAAALADVTKERDAWKAAQQFAKQEYLDAAAEWDTLRVQTATLQQSLTSAQATIARLEKQAKEFAEGNRNLLAASDEQQATIQRLEGELAAYKHDPQNTNLAWNGMVMLGQNAIITELDRLSSRAVKADDLQRQCDELWDALHTITVQRDALTQRLATVEGALKQCHEASAMSTNCEGCQVVYDLVQALAPAPGGQEENPHVVHHQCGWCGEVTIHCCARREAQPGGEGCQQ